MRRVLDQCYECVLSDREGRRFDRDGSREVTQPRPRVTGARAPRIPSPAERHARQLKEEVKRGMGRGFRDEKR